jgi:hypothetical protein
MKKLILAWKDGLRGVQEDLVSAILGGDDYAVHFVKNKTAI